MKKGFFEIILVGMSFVLAMMMPGLQALAMVPVISDIPSPIVSNDDVTGPNEFVYPDAIYLNNFVSDDTSPTAKILWSYETSDRKYLLNGIDPINSTDPSGIEFNPGAKTINQHVAPRRVGSGPRPGHRHRPQ